MGREAGCGEVARRRGKVILLIHQPHWRQSRAHIAVAANLDEVLIGGDYRCLCGARASGRRNWTAEERPVSAEDELCRRCAELWERASTKSLV